MKDEFRLPVEETILLIDYYVEDSIRSYNWPHALCIIFVKINYFF